MTAYTQATCPHDLKVGDELALAGMKTVVVHHFGEAHYIGSARGFHEQIWRLIGIEYCSASVYSKTSCWDLKKLLNVDMLHDSNPSLPIGPLRNLAKFVRALDAIATLKARYEPAF